MNRTINATVFIVAGLLLGSACTSSGNEATISTEPVETTAIAEPTQTTAPTTTETTLSEAQIAAAALAETEAEIEAVVVAWYTYPLDTSLGQAALGLEFTTGEAAQRRIAIAEARTAAGEVQRTGPDQAIELLNIRIDVDIGSAEVDVCARGGGILTDEETGEEIVADDGDSFFGEVRIKRVDGTWLVEDFFSGEIQGDGECFFSE